MLDTKLDRLRTRVNASLPDVCSINHTTGGTINPDGSGEDGTPTVTQSPCRIAPLGTSAVEQVYAARLTAEAGFTVTFPWDVAISEKDTITWGIQTYQVIGTLAPRSFMTAVRVVCRRIT